MKRVKIIIEEIPNDYVNLELISLESNPVKIEPLSDITVTSINEPKRIISRHQMFAYGKDYKEHFYITDEDLRAFEGLFHEFIKRGRLSLLTEIQDFITKHGDLNTYQFLRELEDREKATHK